MRHLRAASAVVLFVALVALPSVRAQQLEWEMKGTVMDDHLGYGATPLGDIDGDGFGDFAVSRPMEHPTATGPGEVRALSGRDHSVLWTRSGSVPKGDYGLCLARLDDVDGTGVADLLVGAPDMDEGGGHDSGTQGRAELLSGATGSVIHVLIGDAPFDYFGQDVCALGDVDGDSIEDFAVGAPGENDGGIDAGSVRVYSGSSGALLHEIQGTQTQGYLGMAVAGPGDLDGDGFGDLLVGAPGYDSTGVNAGAAFLYSGASGSLLWTGVGPHFGAQYGGSVAGIDDLDFDGTPDFAVGAPSAKDGGIIKGGVFVYSGATRALLFTAFGTKESYFGLSLTCIGDVDLDGRGDLLVGAHLADLTGFRSGFADVISGAGGARLSRLYGEATHLFGMRVHWLGDLDGNGQSEIGVFASFLQGKGRLRIFSLGPPLPPASFCSTNPNSQGCEPILSSTGTPTLSGPDDFVIVADQVINQKPGVALWSLGVWTSSLTGAWFCLASPIIRTPPSFTGGNVGTYDCSGAFSFHYSHAYLLSQGLTPGTNVFTQVWYRDPGIGFYHASVTTALAFEVKP